MIACRRSWRDTFSAIIAIRACKSIVAPLCFGRECEWLWSGEAKTRVFEQYNFFQNGRQLDIVLFLFKLAFGASFKGKYSFKF